MAKEGICTVCKEMTQVPGSCCGGSVAIEGTIYNDADYCDCPDCLADDSSACMFDCDTDNECQGCMLARLEDAEREFESRTALGIE